jgi:hypothetical protein
MHRRLHATLRMYENNSSTPAGDLFDYWSQFTAANYFIYLVLIYAMVYEFDMGTVKEKRSVYILLAKLIYRE